jgi:hypothetical protein
MTAPFLLLQLALWTLSAVAFYPFTPEWLKEKEASTLGGEAKRNDVAKAALDGATFKLEKKRQPVSTCVPPPVLNTRLAIGDR